MRMLRLKESWLISGMLLFLMALIALPGLFAAPAATVLTTVPEVAVCCADICQNSTAPVSVTTEPVPFAYSVDVCAPSGIPISCDISAVSSTDAPEVAPRCCCSRCVNFNMNYALQTDNLLLAVEHRVKGGHRLQNALIGHGVSRPYYLITPI
jgi:hypothetical protein